jgi:hypothetical protein
MEKIAQGAGSLRRQLAQAPAHGLLLSVFEE